MHPNFYLTGNMVCRNSYQKPIRNRRSASSKPVACKVYAETNGKTQCVNASTLPDATRQAWVFVSQGATLVWIESEGVKRCIKGSLVY